MVTSGASAAREVGGTSHTAPAAQGTGTATSESPSGLKLTKSGARELWVCALRTAGKRSRGEGKSRGLLELLTVGSSGQTCAATQDVGVRTEGEPAGQDSLSGNTVLPAQS